ncbi:ABC transporter substrate-binding protein [Variovorax sp. J22P240]|uniref:ABC transporter substrate-binding protein n=1 Tax=Variovorax sp. J22P240 TaxID=3053514 RepID=UPI0025771436|nr:ABC transporter substrate-binding protein [Variovorax sp. J22P240]MDM0001849.1 ABC transporter substrate-binding protein [Variovorax sp. J22P240]
MALAIGAACVSHAALAQRPSSKVLRIGYLDTTSASIASVRLERLRAGLRDLGYVEGRNIVIEPRWAESEYARLPDLAAELLKEKPDVIVAAGPAAIRVMRQATTTLPIVFAASGDPLMFGFVQSLSRPGGNVTGVSSVGGDLSYKYLEFLRDAIPRLSTVAVLMNPGHPGHPVYLRNIQVAARKAIRVLPLQAASAQQIEAVFNLIKQEQDRVQALIVLGDGLFFSEARRIAELAVQQKLPTLFSTREPVQVGALMSYGPNLGEQFYRAASYVDKILKGAHPGDLPVEQPTTFELVINPRTAKAIGLVLQKGLLLRADALVE